MSLTQEEIDELVALLNPPDIGSIVPEFDKGHSMYEYGYDSYKSYIRHEWKPILLLNSTVYDCRFCGVKKEETKSSYCNDDEF